MKKILNVFVIVSFLVGSIFTIFPSNAFAERVFSPAVNYSVGIESNPRSVTSGDFNKDGNLDLVTANWGSSNVSILLGVGDGSFGSAQNYVVGSSPRFVASGDFDKDGNLDLAVANWGSSNVSILLGVGDGSFGSANNYDTGGLPISITLGDFNKEGNLDLAVANSGSDNVSILLGVGDGSFDSAQNYAVGDYPYSVTSGDFDKDGDLDLAVANYLSNNVSILLGVGDGSFVLDDNYTVGTSPISITSGDFDKDGNLDLAVANNNSNNVSILLGVGNGSFILDDNYTLVTHPYFITSGDFDKDGNLDLVTANADSHNIFIFLNIEVITPNIPEGITRISINNQDEEGNSDSFTGFNSSKTISSDGQYVTFTSSADNLIEEDANGGNPDIFLYNHNTSQIEKINSSMVGISSYISNNGKYVAYWGYNEDSTTLNIYDTQTRTTNIIDFPESYFELIESVDAPFYAIDISVSDDGDIVISPSSAFLAMIMMYGEEPPFGIPSVAIYDSQTEQFTTIAESSMEEGIFYVSASISANGEKVSYLLINYFESSSTVLVYDTIGQTSEELDLGDYFAIHPSISSSGRYVSMLAGNYTDETYSLMLAVYDNNSNNFIISEQFDSVDITNPEETIPLYIASTLVSDDGRFVVFSNNYVLLMFSEGQATSYPIYLFDTQTEELVQLVEGTEHFGASISGNGQYVVFSSMADNLVANDTNESPDVFLMENPFYEEEEEEDNNRRSSRTSSSGSSPAVIASFQAEQLARALAVGLITPTNPSTDSTSSPQASSGQATLNLTRMLKLTSPMMQGEDVKSLQTYLNTHGYDCGLADGVFGTKTKQAVIKFQIANNLTPDGIVGKLTMSKMK